MSGRPLSGHWDYLVVTASNAAQAAAYQRQLAARRVEGVGEALVVAETPDGGKEF